MHIYITQISRFFYSRSFGLLLVRVAAGSIFFIHGYAKLSDMSATLLIFDSFGLSPLVAMVVTWLQVIGGLALIVGAAPRVFAMLLGIEMLLAASILALTRGFLGVQFELLLAAVSFGIMLMGSGRFALFNMECDTCSGLMCIRKNRVCVTA